MVIFLRLSMGDALKTKRVSTEKLKSARDGVEEPARRPLGRAQLCLPFWMLLAGPPLPGKKWSSRLPGQWVVKEGKNEGERTKERQMPKLGRKERAIKKQGKEIKERKQDVAEEREIEKNEKNRKREYFNEI